ncbi:MAG TPA: thymidine phosphorylase [Trueperaceae bacterium]|jgi:pyrimidine-nucleoside phosphorylase/thymidine phosphorylase
MQEQGFRALDLILAKKAGGEHAAHELSRLVDGFVAGEVPDYQMAAWLMAVCWRGMTPRETADLTLAMARSGEQLDLSDLPHAVDKHSTGGVGDKTTLVLAPLLASLGATVAKMSGRGLGHTGGTVDKLESIPGFRVDLSEEEFRRQAREVGVVVTGQSKDLAPADGLIYALRDVTGTVESLPLIASSIMSKKLAGGARSIVLDVKVGSGAFMRTEPEARELALAMTAIGRHAGRDVTAVLSRMSEPLGRAVGHALEVNEAMECLRGGGPADLHELCVVLASQVLARTGLAADRAAVERALDDGRAYERFERWVAAQGGDVASLGALPLAPDQELVRAPRAGVIAACEARSVGEAVGLLGGGRARKGDAVDHGVGVVLHAKVGDAVAAGEPVATLYHRGGKGLGAAAARVRAALTVADAAEPLPLIVAEGLGL